jgi:hypothetical protein
METSRSPRTVFLRAFVLGCRLWSDYASDFSRHDFTRPQLFACLALREVLRLSYRKAQVFLSDVPQWLAEIGMSKAPDHNTLWRAFGSLLRPRSTRRALDLLAEQAGESLDAALRDKPLAIDSTCYEPRHRSRHYDRVCRKMTLKEGKKYAQKPGKYGPAVNRSRSRRLRGMPKLALATAAATHQILSVRARIGNGSDCPDFEPLLFDAWRRAAVRTVVADAGYDSEDNHCLARLDMSVRSLIPARIGRPAKDPGRTPPSGYYRRLMKKRLKHKADAAVYAQRSQSETTNSMMKRNLGENLRSITPERQKQEMMLRAIVHNLMLGPDENEDRD